MAADVAVPARNTGQWQARLSCQEPSGFEGAGLVPNQGFAWLVLLSSHGRQRFRKGLQLDSRAGFSPVSTLSGQGDCPPSGPSW